MFKSAHELVVAAKQVIREVAPTEIQALLAEGGSLLLDVREPEEFQMGRLGGAVGLPRGLLEFRLSADPGLQNVERQVVVYCKTGGRSALAAQSLLGMGFRRVTSLAGGFDGWLGAGLPVVEPQDLSFD
ncbi:MAG: hypothetical protein RIR00_1705 [Pseudomonadota bacterium]